MRGKSMRDKLEEKIFYFYNNYNKNGFIFDQHMPFEDPDESKYISGVIIEGL